MVEDESWITKENLESLVKGRKLDRVIIEYNGMWMLDRLYRSFPDGWQIYQNMMFAEAKTFVSYNANMRQLCFDKLKDAEMIVLNRADDSVDKEEIHKVVRGITRRAAIVYDYLDGHVEYDDIEDPLPFDIEASPIIIEDGDYALWYRDLSEEMNVYEGKDIKFKGIVAKDPRLPANSVIIGRHVMTCCEADIQYSGLICVFKEPVKLKTRDWVTIKGKIKVEAHKLYKTKGPIIYVDSTEFAVPPSQEVATFY